MVCLVWIKKMMALLVLSVLRRLSDRTCAFLSQHPFFFVKFISVADCLFCRSSVALLSLFCRSSVALLSAKDMFGRSMCDEAGAE
jgi:hypothetical protein